MNRPNPMQLWSGPERRETRRWAFGRWWLGRLIPMVLSWPPNIILGSIALYGLVVLLGLSSGGVVLRTLDTILPSPWPGIWPVLILIPWPTYLLANLRGSLRWRRAALSLGYGAVTLLAWVLCYIYLSGDTPGAFGAVLTCWLWLCMTSYLVHWEY